MLNNLTNFFNLIRGRKIKKTLADSDLIPIGVRDDRFDGNYQPSAIKYEDLAAQVGGLQTVSVDGVTITGNGTPGNPLIAVGGSGTVTYSNVLFVDPVNGNNSTALINRFDKPFLNINSARQVASTISRDSTNRALIYIRKGVYFWDSYLIDNCDYYCDPGVVIFGGGNRLSDVNNGAPVTANFLGHAILYGVELDIRYGSTVKYQFKSLVNTTAAGFFIPNATANVIIEADYISSNTLGASYVFTLRGPINLTANIKEQIVSPYTHWALRNSFSGTFVLNCPKSVLTADNPYNYVGSKQIVYATDTTSTARITINGDFVSTETTYYSGASGLLSLWGFGTGTLNLNGNIYAGINVGIFSNISFTTNKVTVNGSIYSDTRPIAAINVGNLLVKNGTILTTNTSTSEEAIYSGGSAQTYLYNCNIVAAADKNIVKVDSTTTKLQLYNCTAYSSGTLGESVYASSAGYPVRLHNFRTNKAISANVVDVLSPTGLIVDSNLIVPNF